jgi:LysR family transcriptional regulator, regulator for bpeEF and oprC
MDRFQAMQVFTRVVDANSFTAAADSLGLPRTTVTTTIQNLERHLHVRLLNRTTRKLSLTPDGAAYYDRCQRILADLEDTESLFLDAQRGPRGRLRIDVPPTVGRQLLIPNLCEFHTRYPDVELVIGMSDRTVDMVSEAVDCVIRIGELKDSSIVAKRIGTFAGLTCAAPAYLERFGVPHTLADLQQHQAVHYFSSRTGRTCDWEYVIDGEIVEVKMRGAISVNDGDAYVACGLQGFGLIIPAHFMVQKYLDSGALVPVLPELLPPPMAISAMYLQNRHLSPKVRVFIDWVSELFARCPMLGGSCVDETLLDDLARRPSYGHTLRNVIENWRGTEHAI